jgi:hypothetical protein
MFIITTNLLTFSITIMSYFKREHGLHFMQGSLALLFFPPSTYCFPFQYLHQSFPSVLYPFTESVCTNLIFDQLGPKIRAQLRNFLHLYNGTLEGYPIPCLTWLVAEEKRRGKMHSNKESEMSCQIPSERQENALRFVSHFIIHRVCV